MSVVTMDPSSCMLRPLETVRRLVKAPKFLADASGAFAEFIVDNMIRPSAANSSISADATVVVSQAHMGVTLFRQQRDTSRLLAGFVYKMLVPDEAVPTGTRFRKCYRITDQREAQQGTYDTVTNGVQTREYSQVFQHTSKVVTMQFGSLLNVTVPSVAMDLIRRELDRVSTSWELTRTIEVLKYCAAQPTLTDMVAQRTKTYSPAEKLDAILVMAELLCGVINLQPDSFLCVLENARRMLGSDKPEVIVVGDTLFRIISQRSSNSTLCTQIVTEDTKITPEFSVYTMANENTRVGGGYEFTMQQHTHTLGDKDLPFTNESCFQDSSIDMKYDGAVACVSLRDLHPVGNPKELFTHDRRTILQNHVNALMRGNPDAVPVEKLACLALTRDWYGKIKNPASVLEFDARNMVVPRPPQGSFDRDVVPERWVVRPRVALFNSSSMNSIDNEIAQIGSELLTHFGDTEHAKQVSDNLAFLEQALHYEQGVQSMLRMRAAILTGAFPRHRKLG
ncbi:hypothetical protein D5F01_LYC24595 [Larimichthys crocea]|uniref:Uncharacterized protein n=1 Tax=Larimichthys crocea TaxID=215358 RepID=A0A6G0HE04_LARCR|nr:hypothetical protein D5F01_LYC24595 [Larimichthys crocea]